MTAVQSPDAPKPALVFRSGAARGGRRWNPSRHRASHRTPLLAPTSGSPAPDRGRARRVRSPPPRAACLRARRPAPWGCAGRLQTCVRRHGWRQSARPQRGSPPPPCRVRRCCCWSPSRRTDTCTARIPTGGRPPRRAARWLSACCCWAYQRAWPGCEGAQACAPTVRRKFQWGVERTVERAVDFTAMFTVEWAPDRHALRHLVPAFHGDLGGG